MFVESSTIHPYPLFIVQSSTSPQTSKFKGKLMCITVSHQVAVPHQVCMIGHAYTPNLSRADNPEEEKN
jgi:hypothetical protein